MTTPPNTAMIAAQQQHAYALLQSFNRLVQRATEQIIFIGTVADSALETVKIIRPGQRVADNTFYPAAPGVANGLVAGDQVLVVRLGASFFIVAKNAGRLDASTGTAALPAHVAGTYSLFLPNTLASANKTVQITVWNFYGDATAGRGVSAWLGAVSPGVGFTIEYHTIATMATDWVAVWQYQ